MADFGLKDRVVVVTGGNSGIGEALSLALGREGATVAILARDKARSADVVARIGREGPGRAVARIADMRDPESCRAAIESVVAEFGRLDALVNNAGIAVFKPIGETSFAEWRQVLGVNLDGAFLCTQACAPVMRAGGGAVVNIASISGLRASTLRVAYGTSKAALIHLTKQQAVELGTVGIRVNAIAPGPVDTEMAKLVHSVAIRSDYHDVIPLNRYGTTEEIAEAVGFLCSPAASYVNGQVLAVDGGFDATGVGLPTLRRNAAQDT